ncbi:metallophosphoesterase [Halobaculum sp. D14]|uniref:metallophosphoesterase n=1 Tax=Halobaculum sp. D14 TaxID=3421642 RepID=UPI003EC00833
MTRILHVSDTHLGKRQYGDDTRREDFADAFDAAIDLAIDEQVDAVIHTGDLFDDPQPGVPDVNRCLDTLAKLNDAGIPFYGIVGNHERKLDEQWLDLIDRFDLVHHLDETPTLMNDDVALYGIDAIRAPSWNTYEFDLEDPPASADVTIVCMHHLFEELVPPQQANYELQEVIDQLNITPTAIALGDYHGYTEETVDGVQAFYPGSTERCSTKESAPRGVLLLEAEAGDLEIRRRTLDTPAGEAPRDFLQVPVQFGEQDGLGFVEQRLEEALGPDETLDEQLVVVELHGDDTTVSQRDVYELVASRGAGVVHVQDKRRASVDLDFEGGETDVADIQSLIDETISELDIQPTSSRIEEVVRATDATKDSHIRNDVEEILEEEREARFDDIEEDQQTAGDA